MSSPLQCKKIDIRECKIQDMLKLDRELQAVFASLTPSLEALSKLAPEDKVVTFQNLISDLKRKADKLKKENVKIREMVENFRGNLDSGTIAQSDYIKNFYKNEIMAHRTQRSLDPGCNKNIQCRLDVQRRQELSKATQTTDLEQLVKDFLNEAEEAEKTGIRTVEARVFQPVHVNEEVWDGNESIQPVFESGLKSGRSLGTNSLDIRNSFIIFFTATVLSLVGSSVLTILIFVYY